MSWNMKELLAKLRCSFALDRDEAQPRSASERDAIGNNETGFESLAERLRESRPDAVSRGDLHSSIMRAVRADAGGRQESNFATSGLWAAATAGALILGMSVWWFNGRPSAAKAGPASADELHPMIGIALVQGVEFTQKAPDAALAPLVGEMELLNRDFRTALDHVVATMP